MSDERKKVRSSKASPEVRDSVARLLGFKAVEVLAVYDNVDGLYAVVKDGHRLLLNDEDHTVAWYGDTAPNPSYPLVVPTVELDETDEPEGGPLETVVIGEEGPELVYRGGSVGPASERPKPPPKHGAGSSKEAWTAYAAEHQVDVSEAATREQIWLLLEQADVPTDAPTE